MLYFRGEPGSGDLFYVRTHKDGKFSAPIKVNNLAGSAVATGNIRGGQIALGKNGRVHVSWYGSMSANPKKGHGSSLYHARLNDAGTAFEPQHNVIREAFGLDGGSVAADSKGNVFITWHAPMPGTKGEDKRCVWLATSSDDGKTFSPEKKINVEATGACGCCGIRAFVDGKDDLFVLYRSAFESTHRDINLLTSKTAGTRFDGLNLHKWEIATCPMSLFSFAETKHGVQTAWDNDGQVYFARIDPATGKATAPIAAPGEGKSRKHPVMASNSRGETILAWTEGMGWNRGGSLAWQVYDRAGNPTAQRGSAAGVPVWSLVAVFARPDGSFVIVH